ncbi:hypothetical protein BC792_11630 [Sphingobacterium allocomposti]|uniref:Uncharacterized protein n=1 Tax=Sphingobacterium allocomposti TaxID=415956 RepID=A0A5S5DAK0_9SPHI|nr:hypothetical protein BC792_11630 [Sphingobacterium composti Yoo et al. 2007 non Ten et al. 2007]
MQLLPATATYTARNIDYSEVADLIYKLCFDYQKVNSHQPEDPQIHHLCA